MSDLFDFFEKEQAEQKVYTVGELTREIRDLLEESFGYLWLTGEVSNLSRPRSGHLYFSLKDKEAQIQAVIWRSTASQLPFSLEDGLEILVYGRLTVYPGRGIYQILPEIVELKGIGPLELAFRKLKEKLEKEGLFAKERKRPIPTLPRRIGIVTSPTGAAIRDMLKTIYSRFPYVQVVLAPVRVQGEGAAEEIAQAVRDLNHYGQVDVIIVGRGGGSLEDLWAFNEEVVARAIFASSIPVISAVGHEVDISISDLVADLRAPTPTAAGEMVVPRYEEITHRLKQLSHRLERAVLTSLEQKKDILERWRKSHALAHPQEILLKWAEKLDHLATRLELPMEKQIQEWKEKLNQLSQRLFRSPLLALEKLRGKLATLSAKVEGQSPLEILKRGYAIPFHPHQGVLASVENFQVGEKFFLRLKDGLVVARVESVQKGDLAHGEVQKF